MGKRTEHRTKGDNRPRVTRGQKGKRCNGTSRNTYVSDPQYSLPKAETMTVRDHHLEPGN